MKKPALMIDKKLMETLEHSIGKENAEKALDILEDHFNKSSLILHSNYWVETKSWRISAFLKRNSSVNCSMELFDPEYESK